MSKNLETNNASNNYTSNVRHVINKDLEMKSTAQEDKHFLIKNHKLPGNLHMIHSNYDNKKRFTNRFGEEQRIINEKMFLNRFDSKYISNEAKFNVNLGDKFNVNSGSKLNATGDMFNVTGDRVGTKFNINSCSKLNATGGMFNVTGDRVGTKYSNVPSSKSSDMFNVTGARYPNVKGDRKSLYSDSDSSPKTNAIEDAAKFRKKIAKIQDEMNKIKKKRNGLNDNEKELKIRYAKVTIKMKQRGLSIPKNIFLDMMKEEELAEENQAVESLIELLKRGGK